MSEQNYTKEELEDICRRAFVFSWLWSVGGVFQTYFLLFYFIMGSVGHILLYAGLVYWSLVETGKHQRALKSARVILNEKDSGGNS